MIVKNDKLCRCYLSPTFDAVLFDMDGTLTKNAHFHDLAWEILEFWLCQIMRHYGYGYLEFENNLVPKFC